MDREFSTMRKRMNNLLENLGRIGSLDGEPWRAARLLPLLNIIESDDAYIVSTEAPGMDLEDLEIRVEGRTLCIKGARGPHRRATADLSSHRRERAVGRFQRSVVMPESVDPTGIQANYKNGVLEIVLPRLVSDGPKKIEITTG
jgi:HSP20 family protein